MVQNKNISLEEHLRNYDELINFLSQEIERKQKEREKGIRTLQSTRKKVVELRSQIPKVIKNRRKRKTTNANKVSGFVMKCKISEELANFMQLPKDELVTRSDITNAICAYIHLSPDEKRENVLRWKHLNPEGKRNLQNPENKTLIIPDQKLRTLLNYDKYVDDVQNGRVTKKVLNKETQLKEEVIIKNPSLRYWVIQKLVQPHILETVNVSNE